MSSAKRPQEKINNDTNKWSEFQKLYNEYLRKKPEESKDFNVTYLKSCERMLQKAHKLYLWSSRYKRPPLSPLLAFLSAVGVGGVTANATQKLTNTKGMIGGAFSYVALTTSINIAWYLITSKADKAVAKWLGMQPSIFSPAPIFFSRTAIFFSHAVNDVADVVIEITSTSNFATSDIPIRFEQNAAAVSESLDGLATSCRIIALLWILQSPINHRFVAIQNLNSKELALEEYKHYTKLADDFQTKKDSFDKATQKIMSNLSSHDSTS